MPATPTDAYLARIGYEGPRDPSLATLRAVHERHLLAVPFENLDIHWKRRIVVDPGRFFDKVVFARRGGFCYELNGAFGELLRTMGFDVTMLSARVVTAEGTFGPPFDHMALMVRFEDGSRWLADVGFGDSFLQPLNLDARLEQHDPAGVFRIVHGDETSEEWHLQVRRNETWSTEFLFTLASHELREYVAMCDFQQDSPESSFTKKRICTIATATGRVTLTDAKLIITREGQRTEVPVPGEEWDDVLFETFGIRA